MDGMKRLRSVLDVKADRIHHSVSSVNSIGHRPIIVDVGFDRLKLRIIKTKQLASPVRMPGCNPYEKPMFTEMSNNATAEESGSAEHGDDPLLGRRHGSTRPSQTVHDLFAGFQHDGEGS